MDREETGVRRQERDAFGASVLRAEPAVPPLSRPRNKRDGIARYSGHKRRATRKQGGTVEYFDASPLIDIGGGAFLHPQVKMEVNNMSEEVKISEENQFSFENPEYRKTLSLIHI
mgnify:FL=1